MEKIIQQGAEALIILDKDVIKKRRTKKSYRLHLLDEKIRKQRTKREAKLLEKAYKIIPVPKIIKTFEEEKEIDMELIEGKKLSEHLNTLPNKLEICRQIGENIAKLHDHDIIHGDLTTSNMLLKEVERQGTLVPYVYFIDFGLGFTSKRAEDKAVDLHLIKEALEAKHFAIAKPCFESILEGYKTSKHYSQVLQRLKKVESRGRYKPQY